METKEKAVLLNEVVSIYEEIGFHVDLNLVNRYLPSTVFYRQRIRIVEIAAPISFPWTSHFSESQNRLLYTIPLVVDRNTLKVGGSSFVEYTPAAILIFGHNQFLRLRELTERTWVLVGAEALEVFGCVQESSKEKT